MADMTGVTGATARDRALADYATYEVVWLGKSADGKLATWDITDTVGPQRVDFEIATRLYRCDCAFYATGGGQPCIHIEVLKHYREQQAAASKAAPSAPPATAPAPPPVAPVAPPPAPVAPEPPAAARSDTLLAAAGIISELAGLRIAAEGILARMTPAEERDRTVVVDGYVRSANKGGELVWLYGAHPGLQYRVAVVYAEDFPALVEFLDPAAGRVFDGEVAPSKATATTKGYLVTCRAPFEVVLAPTGRRTDNDQMIYRFRAARAVGH